MRNMLVGTSKDYSMRQDELCKKSMSWEKHYNLRRRDVHIKVNDLVLLQIHFLSAASRKQVGKFMPKFEGPYKVLEIKGNNLVIWKNGRNITVNIDQVRVYRPRQSDTISSDSPVETLYDEQEVSHGSNRSNQGQFKEHRKTSSQESEGCRSRQGVESIAGPSRLPDRRTATTTGGSRMEVSGRDNQTRQTRATTRGRNKQAEKPVRSNQATTRRPCPYYLRSRIQENDGILEELSNIKINGIPHSTLRRRSLSMEALDGDPSECLNQIHKEKKSFVKEKLASSPVEKETKKQKNSANLSSATAKSRSEYMRECRARKKTLQNTLLMPSLMTNVGNAIETLLITAQINTDFVNHPVPSTTELNKFSAEIPAYLLTLDLVSGRLISPRIPFVQIRRLRHVHSRFGRLGQIINVPVSINTIVNRLPRNVDDDYCVIVHIKRRKIHRTSYLMGLVTKRTIKAWLQYLVATPLYRMYDVAINDIFFNLNQSTSQVPQEEISENITIEESYSPATDVME
ncbi:helitron_like_N domain-containing protein [Trichonephila clavipes]|nr:helitron_like_N domain-containing protein [Trichonephila clavipes]